jgi:hypothetical protein
MSKGNYKWPEVIEPQLKTREARREFLSRPRMRRWLQRIAPGLRVLDVRHFLCTDPVVIEFTEIYHQVETRHGKQIKVKLVCSDPPPYIGRRRA